MINETQDATNIINQMDEKAAPSMNLGNSTNSVINLNSPKQIKALDDSGGNYSPEPTKSKNEDKPMFGGKKEPDTKKPEMPWTMTEETKALEEAAKKLENKEQKPELTPEDTKNYEEKYNDKSQGEMQTELENIYKEIENKLESISWLEDYLKKFPQQKNQFPEIDEIKKEIAALRDEAYWLKNYSNYDNRTEDQIRADKSTQLKVEDYIKAGLNPAAVSGYHGSAGGGGGSSSSNDEEERKRKKRERELARQREKERRQEMAMKMLGMLVNTGTSLTSAGIRAKGFRDSATIRNQGMIDNTWAKVASAPYLK